MIDMLLNVKKLHFEEMKLGIRNIEYVPCNNYWTEKIINNIYRDLPREERMAKKELFKKGAVIKFNEINNGCIIHKGFTKESLTANVYMITVIDGSKAKPKRNGLTIAIYLESIIPA